MSGPRVSEPARPLQRDRNLGQLLDDTLALYRRHAAVVLLLTAAVVVPVELLVSGIGLGQLTASYSSTATPGGVLFGSLVPVLVTTPLVTGMLVRVVLDDAAGEPVSFRRAASAGLEAFAPLLGAILLVTVAVVLGAFALLVPGMFLAVRFAVVPPAVVVEGRRGAGALRRSWELVTGSSWWVFGVLLMLALLLGVAGAVISLPAEALGRSADSRAFVLLGDVVAQILTLPFSALATTLLYFTLRARRADSPDAPAPRAPAPEAEAERLPGGWEPPVPPR